MRKLNETKKVVAPVYIDLIRHNEHGVDLTEAMNNDTYMLRTIAIVNNQDRIDDFFEVEPDDWCENPKKLKAFNGNDYLNATKLWMWCPHCKQAGVPKVEWTLPAGSRHGSGWAANENAHEGFYDTPSTVQFNSMQCSHCNSEIDRDDIVLLNGDPHAYAGHAIFIDGDKVKMKYQVKCVYPSKDYKKLKKYFITVRLVFNVKTGQTYALAPWVNGRPYKNPKLIKQPNRIINVSYGTGFDHNTYLFHFLPKDTFRHLGEKLHEALQAQYSDIKVPKYELTKINDAFSYVRYPWLSPKSFSRIVESCYHGLYYYTNPEDIKKYKKSVAKIKNKHTDVFGTIFSAFNMKHNTKSLRKYLTSNDFQDFLRVNRLCNMLGDVNNVMAMLNDDIDIIDVNDKFIKDMIEFFGENVWVRKMVDNDNCQHLRDASRMYMQLLEAEVTPIIEKKMNMKDIHETLVNQMKKAKFKNKPFHWTVKQQEMFTFDYNNYTFRLANGSHHLIDIGNDMGICVGGYSDSVLRGDTAIVICKIDGQNKVCIELTKDGKHMSQTKLKFNRYPEGDEREAITAYCEFLGIDIKTVRDMDPEMMKLNKPESEYRNQYRRNYAGEFIRDNQPLVQLEAAAANEPDEAEWEIGMVRAMNRDRGVLIAEDEIDELDF